MRRLGGLSDEETVASLYNNMLTEYQIYIRRTETTLIRVLTKLASEYELIKQKKETEEQKESPNYDKQYVGNRTKFKKPSFNTNPRSKDQPKPTMSKNTYNRETSCWKCRKPRHNRFQWKNESITFCSFCGKRDVWTKDCPENQKGAGAIKANRPK